MQIHGWLKVFGEVKKYLCKSVYAWKNSIYEVVYTIAMIIKLLTMYYYSKESCLFNTYTLNTQAIKLQSDYVLPHWHIKYPVNF